MPDKHTQLKAKCLECGLHFIVCTERPKTHSLKTLYCPECGQRNGQYLTWSEKVADPIWKYVPGASQPTPDMQFEEGEAPLEKLVRGKPRRMT